MAIADGINAPQGGILAGVRATAAGINAPQGGVLAAYNIPSLNMRATAGGIDVTVRQESPVSVTQAGIFALARGHFTNNYIKAWAYSQDGHDFYVLRLGEQATLVYDVSTQQWSQWDGSSNSTWRASYGLNWIGVAQGDYFGGVSTPVICGDDSTGVLWTLDPVQGYDDNIDSMGADIPVIRAIRGGIPFRGRHRSRTNGVWLTISNGLPVLPLAAVTLRTSDDQGVTWQERGSITVTPNDYSQNLYWRSLGLMRAPGRLFEFEDNGAMIRIDSADVDMSKDDQGGPSN